MISCMSPSNVRYINKSTVKHNVVFQEKLLRIGPIKGTAHFIRNTYNFNE